MSQDMRLSLGDLLTIVRAKQDSGPCFPKKHPRVDAHSPYQKKNVIILKFSRKFDVP